MNTKSFQPLLNSVFGNKINLTNDQIKLLIKPLIAELYSRDVKVFHLNYPETSWTFSCTDEGLSCPICEENKSF